MPHRKRRKKNYQIPEPGIDMMRCIEVLYLRGEHNSGIMSYSRLVDIIMIMSDLRSETRAKVMTQNRIRRMGPKETTNLS